MYKNVLNSTLPLTISVLLFVFVGNYGVGRVLSLRSEISQVKADKAALTEKLNTLQVISATVGTGSQIAASALPEKNTALVVFSQLKSVAGQNAVNLSNLKSGAEVKDATGISRVDISFDLNGPEAGVLAFLDGVQKIAPITLVDKLKSSRGGGQAQATVTVKSFWVAFPKRLPSVTQQVTDLTQDEKNTLEKVTALAQPQFLDLPASQTEGRANPFAP